MDYNSKAINEGILTELGQNGYMYGYKAATYEFESRIKERIYDLQMMQIQSGDDYEFCLQMEYAIKELDKIINPPKSI